jgi:Leucine-rich repeat (LRR) protein
MRHLVNLIVSRPVRASLALLLLGCESSTEPPSLCTTQAEITVVECEALVAVYEATNGAGWTRSEGWLDAASPCAWQGVTCRDGTVEGLDLNSNQLAGSIPPEVGDLTGLQRLKLAGNALTGSIPPTLENLARLENLELAANDLTGPIPPELGSLDNLVFLYFFSNRLSGSIPPELASMSSLRMLFLRDNELTGTIPAGLGTMPALQRLVINDNRLIGTVPEALGALDGLDTFWIDGNDLEGELPLAVARMGAAIQGATIEEDCRVRPGNDGLFIPDDDAYRAADLDGDGLICGLALAGAG